tara:strand:- start:3024 stop:3383 length:360 start_codon:yes stop_codon:yes gene_type:complete
MRIPTKEKNTAPLSAPRHKMSDLDAEKLIAKLVDKVDLSYPKAIRDKSINLQTALAVGVVKAMLNMAEKEGLPLEKVEKIELMQLMLDLISSDMSIGKDEVLEKFLQNNTVYQPKEKSL